MLLFQDASHPEKLYKLGQAVRATVVEASIKPHRFVLSLTGRRCSDFGFFFLIIESSTNDRKKSFVSQVSINWRKVALLWE